MNENRLIAYDDLFGLDGVQGVTTLLLSSLVSFKDHPFRVLSEELDPDMVKLIESIADVGILEPIEVRPAADRRYEIISGHRRVYAAGKAGLTEIPARIVECTDDEAVVRMVDSNLHREKILPSEKAWAYRMRLEAIKHQGKRNDLTSCKVCTKSDDLRSDASVATNSDDSARTIQNYIRLTYLIPELLQQVDEGKLKLMPAVNLSYLTESEQQNLLETMLSESVTPSLKQSQRLKELSRAGELTIDVILDLLMKKKPEQAKVIFKSTALAQFFPDCTPAEMERRILQILTLWSAQQKLQGHQRETMDVQLTAAEMEAARRESDRHGAKEVMTK